MSEEINLNDYVPNVHFELIPIKNLVSNQDYQRNLSIKHVQRAAANFDVCQINPVKISRRDGINYVFNGQHTIEIVASVSGSRDTPVWCMIYDDLEYTQEADIFANQMKYNKPLLPYEIFVANMEAGSDKQLLINSLVESYGLTISKNSGPGKITSISTLEYIYNQFGFHILDRTIMLIAATWEGEDGSFSSTILKSVSMLVYAFGDEIKDTTFKEKLAETSIKAIKRDGKYRNDGILGYAEAILSLYNKKMSFGLSTTKLREKLKKTPKVLPPTIPISSTNPETVPIVEDSSTQMSIFSNIDESTEKSTYS